MWCWLSQRRLRVNHKEWRILEPSTGNNYHHTLRCQFQGYKYPNIFYLRDCYYSQLNYFSKHSPKIVNSFFLSTPFSVSAFIILPEIDLSVRCAFFGKNIRTQLLCKSLKGAHVNLSDQSIHQPHVDPGLTTIQVSFFWNR